MNSNDAKTRYNRVILKVNIFSKSSKKQPFSNLFQLIWNLSIDKKVVLMAALFGDIQLCNAHVFPTGDVPDRLPVRAAGGHGPGGGVVLPGDRAGPHRPRHPPEDGHHLRQRWRQAAGVPVLLRLVQVR